jgi:hypothetical protein
MIPHHPRNKRKLDLQKISNSWTLYTMILLDFLD